MASSAGSSPETSTSAIDRDVTRPRRPPRRVSRMFDTSPNQSSTSTSTSTTNEGGPITGSNYAVQETSRAIGSQLDRLKGQSRSTDSDLDRTPTKYNHYTASTVEKSRIYSDSVDGFPSQGRASFKRQAGERTALRHASASNLRHQSSAATIRSSELADVADLRASTSTARTVRPESRATIHKEEEQTKSSMYEREIEQMRSESRLGSRYDDDEERSFSRSSIQPGTDATDTSGTEGSGPIVENRRRKKSSTSSSTKRAAARAASARDQKDPTVVRTSPPKERAMTTSARSNHAWRDPYTTMTSPLRTESAMEFNLPNRLPAPRRAPLGGAFTSPHYRSDGLVDSDFSADRKSDTSGQSLQGGEMWARGEEMPPEERERPEERRRRHVSDANPSASNVQSRQGRMVADMSGVIKHLAQSSRYGSVAENRNDWSDRSSSRSVSEVIRPRKVSQTSSLSQRSLGAASELHRTASRASLRKSFGKDVFDDGGVVPPLPSNSGHLSPRHLAPDQFQQQTQAMAQALRQKQERVREAGSARGEDWMKEVEELQARIDQLAMTAPTTAPLPEIYSRSSSRASAFAPRSSHSNVSSTPSASLGRRPTNRPSTEPRPPRVDPTGRSSSDVSSGYLRYEASSRLGLRESERRMPVTPSMAETRAIGSVSRMSGVSTGPMPSSGRFSSLGQSGNRSLSASSSAGPLHERNLLNSFEIFERYLLESTRIASDSSSLSPRSATEAVDLVNRFKETTNTAISINAGLRSILQNILELQIDAEVGESAADRAIVFADIDRSVSTILRDSDEQVRSLTDGLITFTRAEKERDRIRKKRNDQINTATMVPRTASRLSSLGLSQVSPGKGRERPLGRESQQGHREAERRTSSLDLRRSMSIRDRMTASFSNTSMQAVESRSDRSNGSRKSSDSGKQSRMGRRFSLLHEISPGTSTTSTQLPPSPYSPSPNPTSIAPTDTSPTFDMHSTSDRLRSSRLGHRNSSSNMSHARSYSELSPKVRSNVDGEILQRRSPLLRRDKSSTNSIQTVRAPSSLSPRRSRLSFPRVSATTVNAMAMASATSEEERANSSESHNGFTADVYRDETKSIFKSLGRSRGLQVSREM